MAVAPTPNAKYAGGVPSQGLFGGFGAGFGNLIGTAQKAMGGGGMLGLDFGALGVLGQLFQGLFGGQSEDSALRDDTLAPTVEYPTPALAPIAGVGGEKDRIRPMLTGTSNTSNPWGCVPVCLGKDLLMYPLVTANPVVKYRGKITTLSVVFEFGYGPLDIPIETLKVGDKQIDEILEEDEEYELLPDSVAGDVTKYPGDAQVLDVNEELRKPDAVEKTTPQDADEIIIAVLFEQGLYQFQNIEVEAGSFVQDRIPNTVTFQVSYRKVGEDTWTNRPAWNVTDETAAPFLVGLTFKPPDRDTYEIRVKRTSANSDGITTFGATKWFQLTALIYQDPYTDLLDAYGNPVHMARLAVTKRGSRDAQGALEQVSARPSLKVRTWAEGEWSEELITTDNPAWLALWVMTGPANAKPIPDVRIDFQSFVDFADHCEEKGYTFGSVIDQQTTVGKLVDEILRRGRAALIFKNGKFTAVIDRPSSQIVQVFNRWNSSGLRYKCVHSLRLHGVRVNWLDPEDKEQQAQRIAYNDGYDASNATRYEVRDAYGCRSADEAYKDGRRMIADQELRSKTYEMTTDWESLLCSKGDLVEYSNDTVLIGGGDGRITFVGLTYINIDPVVEIEDGFDYAVTIRLSNRQVLYNTIAHPGAGFVDALEFDPPLPDDLEVYPQAGDLFSFGKVGNVTKTLKVIAVNRGSDLSARLLLQEYQPGVYDAEDGEIPPYNGNETPVPPNQQVIPPPVVLAVQTDESVLIPLGGTNFQPRIVLLLAPQPPNLVKFYEYQYRVSGSENWSAIQDVGAPDATISINATEGVTYDVRVLSKSPALIPSVWTYENSIFVIGRLTKQPDVSRLYFDVDPQGRKRLWWSMENRPVDLAGVQLRMAWGLKGAEAWDDETTVVISLLTVTDYLDIDGFAFGEKTFLVKGVDTGGRVSEHATAAREDFGDIPLSEIAEIKEYHKDGEFPGTHNGTVDDGILKSDPIGADPGMFGPDPGAPMFEDPDAPMFTREHGELIYEFDFTPSYYPAGSLLKLVTDIRADGYGVFYQPPSGSLFYSQGPGADDKPMFENDEQKMFPHSAEVSDVWLPFPEGGVAAKRVKFRFRILCPASTTQALIRKVTAMVDSKPISAWITNLIVPAEGIRTGTAGKTFQSIRSVTLAIDTDLKNFPNAYRARYSDKDDAINGPLIEVFDKDENPVAGRVDIELRGI